MTGDLASDCFIWVDSSCTYFLSDFQKANHQLEAGAISKFAIGQEALVKGHCGVVGGVSRSSGRRPGSGPLVRKQPPEALDTFLKPFELPSIAHLKM